jgi:hypothetical protein
MFLLHLHTILKEQVEAVAMAEGKFGGYSCGNIVDLSKETTDNIVDSLISILGTKQAFFRLGRGDGNVLVGSFQAVNSRMESSRYFTQQGRYVEIRERLCTTDPTKIFHQKNSETGPQERINHQNKKRISVL